MRYVCGPLYVGIFCGLFFLLMMYLEGLGVLGEIWEGNSSTCLNQRKSQNWSSRSMTIIIKQDHQYLKLYANYCWHSSL